MARSLIPALCVLSLSSLSGALDNGLALTPPMGWLTWQRFRCITDCEKYPNECISENLILRTARKMVSDGYLARGYEYVGIDDCWLEKERGPDGRLVPDRRRFPRGMKALADDLHAMGLKFALYQDYGTNTCMGYPGILGSEKLDIDTFAEWEVDYIKLDGCACDVNKMDEGYPYVGKLMNETGRPIVYSCSWPAYQENPDYKSIRKHCNLWRNTDDIQDSWASLRHFLDWFGQRDMSEHAGPGHWNDPDMLLIGNFGLSVDQARVQMAVWSILAAPLLMSVDLDTIKPDFREILRNEEIIAVNQDSLGKQGKRVYEKKDGFSIWVRELSHQSYAVAFVSYRDDGAPYEYSVTFDQTKLPNQTYYVIDLYGEDKSRILDANETLKVRVNPSGVKFYKFQSINSSENDIP